MSDKIGVLQDRIDSLWNAHDALQARVTALEDKTPRPKPSVVPIPPPPALRLYERCDRSITGYEISVEPRAGDRVVLIWRDLRQTEEAEARGESHLVGRHDFEVPFRVIGAAAQILKAKGLIP